MTQKLNFSSEQDRLPPQNIEAEEVILGGIMLDPRCHEPNSRSLSRGCFLHLLP
jgi:replicative DNA helicase